jgi:lipid II:glycine glycyltransferase (peptidoglycan interpeptide bridge formation enzyme)
MTNKQKYEIFCKTESVPIFLQYWWLNTVCGNDNWDVAIVEKNNKIIASMPYFKTKKMMFNMIFMPKLTQFMGPFLIYPKGQKYERKLSYEKEILTILIEQLPNYDFFYQNFHYSITNWLPFYWKGFKQTTRYTYIIEDTSNLELIFSNFRSNIKTDIKKAQKKVKIEKSLDIGSFYEINKMTFERQNMKIPYTFDFLESIHKECLSHNCSKLYLAKDKDNIIHAAIYVIWDKTTMYYLLSGGNPKYRNSGATSLLIWEAIKDASKMGLKFDFEGSMIEPIERFFRAFGAKQVPYFQITKAKNKILHILYQLIKE